MTAACSRCGAPLPRSALDVGDIGVVLAGPDDQRRGLLGWGRATVGPFVLAGLAVRRNGAGDIAVTYPARKDSHGVLHREITSLDPELDRRIRAAVVAAYIDARGKAGPEGRAVIVGRRDTYLTVDELAKMIGRSPKTIHNWAVAGQIQFVYLCNVPLLSMAMVEALIAGHGPEPTATAEAALRAIGRRDREGQRTAPERHRRQRRMTGESSAGPVLPSSTPPVGSSPS